MSKFFIMTMLFLIFGKMSFASEITTEMCLQDKRLEKHVSAISYRVFVGELLADLSEQTGVQLTASDISGASDDRISVCFIESKLTAVLNSIRSLLSYRGAEYQWQRYVSASGKFEYRFYRTDNAKKFPENIRASIQKDFQDEIYDKIHRSKNAQGVRENDARNLSERAKRAMIALNSLVSNEQIAKIIEGSTSVRVPVDKICEEGRAFIASERETHNKFADPTNQSLKWVEPQSIVIQTDGSKNSLTPSLYLLLEREEHAGGVSMKSREGAAWAGGVPLEQKWKKSVSDTWRLSKNEYKEPKTEKPKVNDAKVGTVNNKYGNHVFDKMVAFSVKNHIPVFMRFSHNFPADDLGSGKESMDLFLESILKSGLDYKSYNGFLIVASHLWIRQEREEERLPWETVKSLRNRVMVDALKKLSIADHCFAAEKLSLHQLKVMDNNEGWNHDRWPDMTSILLVKPLYSALHRNPHLLKKVLSPQGLPVDALSPSTQRFLNEQSHQARQSTGNLVVRRVQIIVVEKATSLQREIKILLFGSKSPIADEKPIASFSYSCTSWPIEY